MWRLGLLTTVILLFVTASIPAQGRAPLTPLVVDGERYFKLQWEPGDYRGRPTVRGSIFNDWGLGARNLRVLVDSLDAAGGVTAQTIGYVPGALTAGTRTTFEVPVPVRAASYRVVIFQYEWIQSGGGGDNR